MCSRTLRGSRGEREAPESEQERCFEKRRGGVSERERAVKIPPPVVRGEKRWTSLRCWATARIPVSYTRELTRAREALPPPPPRPPPDFLCSCLSRSSTAGVGFSLSLLRENLSMIREPNRCSFRSPKEYPCGKLQQLLYHFQCGLRVKVTGNQRRTAAAGQEERLARGERERGGGGGTERLG